MDKAIAMRNTLKPTTPCQTDETEVFPIARPGYHKRYPRWIGHKFEPDGRVRRFPGHGVMCHLPAGTEMYKALESFREDLPKQDFSSSLVLLPPSVWHMTVYEGVSDQIRTRNRWPAELKLDCSLDECHDFVASRLASFDLGCKPIVCMSPVGWWPIEDGIALEITGVNSVEEQKLRTLRERLAKELQLWHPGFEKYSFHIGIAYQLRFMDRDTKERMARYLQSALEKLPKEFELGAPAFCTYDDMFALDRKFDLVERSQEDQKKEKPQ